MPDLSTTAALAGGFPLTRKRKRLHPKLAHAEAMRLRRLAKHRPPRGYLWMPQGRPHRELPITTRAHKRWFRETVAQIWGWSAVTSHTWDKPTTQT